MLGSAAPRVRLYSARPSTGSTGLSAYKDFGLSFSFQKETVGSERLYTPSVIGATKPTEPTGRRSKKKPSPRANPQGWRRHFDESKRTGAPAGAPLQAEWVTDPLKP